MSRQPSLQNYGAGKLPVFVFPTSLNFYSLDQSSHKQILTLYNPYDFAFRFRVWCTNPSRYSVSNADGVVRPRCCVDIIIRHKAVIPENEGRPDKFRIQITDNGQKTVLGKKDLLAMLLPHSEAVIVTNDKFESMSSGPASALSAMTATGTEAASALSLPGHYRGNGPNWLVVGAAVLCLVCLFLPTESDHPPHSSPSPLPWLPSYMMPSVTQKLIAAYVLGILTVVLLRS